MAYAKTTDLEARWRKLSEEETARAAVLLEDAATTIRAEGFDGDEKDDETAELLKFISCRMVKRAMPETDAPAVTQGSLTVGPFSQSVTYANPHGEVYLTEKEKALLGLKGQRAAFFSPCGGA